MTRIFGLFGKNDKGLALRMAKRMQHQNKYRVVFQNEKNFCIGVLGLHPDRSISHYKRLQAVWDGVCPLQLFTNVLPVIDTGICQQGRLAFAGITADGTFFVARDWLGIAPLYYIIDGSTFFFASEVKALLEISSHIKEFPPGHVYTSKGDWQEIISPKIEESIQTVDEIAAQLKEMFRIVISSRITIPSQIYHDEYGVWLSGGLDSSIIVAFASQVCKRLHTFSVGFRDSPDLYFARQMAGYLSTIHHEKIVTFEELLKIFSDVIYALESFDALLVRSSLTNYIVAQLAANYVSEVFSGEGVDELFAGYAYLKNLSEEILREEVSTLPFRLHNTALQRVDRCTMAAGLSVHLPFLTSQFFDYLRCIPLKFKLYREGNKLPIEKWILRQAMKGILPQEILSRSKAKFWEGAGVGELFLQYAEKKISDSDFAKEQKLPDGTLLQSKEELMYYRIFFEKFGHIDLSFVGRTREKKEGNH